MNRGQTLGPTQAVVGPASGGFSGGHVAQVQDPKANIG